MVAKTDIRKKEKIYILLNIVTTVVEVLNCRFTLYQKYYLEYILDIAFLETTTLCLVLILNGKVFSHFQTKKINKKNTDVRGHSLGMFTVLT